MNKTIEERAKQLYPNCDPADKLYSALIEDLRAAYIAGATENISGSTSTNTQVTTICAKELRGEAGCKEVCDECKRKTQEELKEFDAYLTETRNSFVKAITEVYPHEERLDDYARSTIRVAAEDILIAFDQLRDRFAAVSTEAEGWRKQELISNEGWKVKLQFSPTVPKAVQDKFLEVIADYLLPAPPTVTK